MHQKASSKRPICAQCLRPQRTCICHWITPVASEIEVLILQHPLEVNQAKGSARLLHLNLLHSRLVIGEIFDEKGLQALLYAPFPNHQSACSPTSAGQLLLLYPENAPNGTSDIMETAVSDLNLFNKHSKPLRLIVLDGTWRKSRKMLTMNPLLQSLPRLSLKGTPASQYMVRKAHRPDQLSTLEATCHALMRLEDNAAKYESILHAFAGFVQEQIRYKEGQLRAIEANSPYPISD